MLIVSFNRTDVKFLMKLLMVCSILALPTQLTANDTACDDRNEPWKNIFTNYVQSYPDLLAAYSKSTNNLSIEKWGRRHYESYGMIAKRSLSMSLPSEIKQRLADQDLELYQLLTSICRLIELHNTNDVNKLRNKLNSFLWGAADLPNALPRTITKSFKDDKRFNDLNNLSRIDKYVIDMDFGLTSIAYHFMQKGESNSVVLVHQGHGGDFFKSKHVIEHFLVSGYDVIAFSMPLLGINNTPTVYLKNFGYRKLDSHDYIKFLSVDYGHPLKYFFEPVIQVLNYLDSHYNYKLVSMTGISGGGWTTTIVSAIDTRIDLSFPVAGSVPIFLRDNDDFGDWEQTVVEFYRLANYPELYVLGAHGRGRKQLQIINLFDNCCYYGPKMLLYGESVKSAVEIIGRGEFDLFADKTTKKHTVSNTALTMITNVMGKYLDEL